jgi:hypothetical protein
MPTREQEFTEVRRILGGPKEGKPSPDVILGALFREEQSMLNKLNGTGKSWTENVTTFTTVVNQPDYVMSSAVPAFGKALYVYRDLGNNIIVPVPFTDREAELMNQNYDIFSIPVQAGVLPPIGASKISFGRFADGSIKARIYPIPEDATTTYTVIYATGALDWSVFEWTDTPILPEWSCLRCLRVAYNILADAEWSGLTRSENMEERKERDSRIGGQIKDEMGEYELFVKNPQNEASITTIGAWYGDEGDVYY